MSEFTMSCFGWRVGALLYLQSLGADATVPPRQPTQDNQDEVRARDFRRELEERERVVVREKARERGPRGGTGLEAAKTWI